MPVRIMTIKLITDNPASVISTMPIHLVNRTNLSEAKNLGPNRAFTLANNSGWRNITYPQPPTQQIPTIAKSTWEFIAP